jgi:hypothetical protein
MENQRKFPCSLPNCNWVGTTFRARRIHETKQHLETNKLCFIGRSNKMKLHKSVKSGKY